MAKKRTTRRRSNPTPPAGFDPRQPVPVVVTDDDNTDPGYVPAAEAATAEERPVVTAGVDVTKKGPVPTIVAHCVDHTPIRDLRKCARLMVQRWQHLPPAAAAEALALVSDDELDAIMRTQLQPKFGERLGQLLDDARQRDAADRRRRERARATKPEAARS